MKSTYLTNLLLLVVAVLLVWLMTESQIPEANSFITDNISQAQVTEIEIQRHQQQTIQLQLDKQWQLIQPAKARANQTRIKLLLSLLEQPVQPPLSVTETTNLADFGLEKPNLILSFNQQRFAFGDIESLSGYRYILHNQQIFLVNDDISPLLGASASSFIDNRLLDPASDIQNLQLPKLLDTNGEQFSAELSIYQQNTSWISKPDNHAQDKLLALLQNWQQAYAMQVVITPENFISEDKPVVVIDLVDNTQRRFFVSHSEDGLTLADPDLQLQYQFPAAMIPALFSINE